MSQNQDIEYQYVVILTGKMMINQRDGIVFHVFFSKFSDKPTSYWVLLAYHGIHTIETIETGYELSNFQHHPSGQFNNSSCRSNWVKPLGASPVEETGDFPDWKACFSGRPPRLLKRV